MDFSASEAFKLSQKKNKINDVNLNLVLKRLFKIIKIAAENGFENVEFTTPSFIPDGSLENPEQLAKKIKSKLKKLGYKIEIDGKNLNIFWNN